MKCLMSVYIHCPILGYNSKWKKEKNQDSMNYISQVGRIIGVSYSAQLHLMFLSAKELN
jgi:hypothetical protein